MRKFIIIFLMLMVAAVQAADHKKKDALLGTYSFQEHGVRTEFLRVIKRGNLYQGQEKSEATKEWSKPFPLTMVNKDDMNLGSAKEKYGDHIFDKTRGFNVGMALLLNVPVGWKYGDFISKTGYCLVTDSRAEDVYHTQ